MMMVGENFAKEFVAFFPNRANGGRGQRGGVVWVADVEDCWRGTTPVWAENL